MGAALCLFVLSLVATETGQFATRSVRHGQFATLFKVRGELTVALTAWRTDRTPVATGVAYHLGYLDVYIEQAKQKINQQQQQQQ
uniref:Uncharacterized protein n=1 Tax=Ditylenchus dipsaci TaxID=166011 RepID=A0A915EPY1_9BILA